MFMLKLKMYKVVQKSMFFYNKTNVLYMFELKCITNKLQLLFINERYNFLDIIFKYQLKHFNYLEYF